MQGKARYDAVLSVGLRAHKRPHVGFPGLAIAFRRTLPAAVRRYFCRRLFGLLGRVISIPDFTNLTQPFHLPLALKPRKAEVLFPFVYADLKLAKLSQ